MAFFCHQCGAALPPNARFCSSCGQSIAAPRVSPARSLVRPRIGRQIGGVCLAFAQSYGWDISIVRIVAVLALLFSSGLIGIAYLAAWIGIPEEPVAASIQPSGTYPPAV